MIGRSRHLITCACVGALSAGCAPAVPSAVVLITLDTTRADRLTTYGLAGAEMPHLERLAREGVVFEQATSVAPLTVPAHASLFTGLFPPSHAVRENSSPPLAPGYTTLAEILSQHGMRSGAVVGSGILDPDRGLRQGFEYYGSVATDPAQPNAPQRRADAVVDEAIAWLERVGRRPFFLWVHLYDPHRPYEPPEPFASRYAHDPYVGEIAYADFQVGRLLDALEDRDALDRAIVIVAGDHGESLGEHGERDHGVFVYESVLRIPLIIRTPGMPPRRVRPVVRLVDVLPTVLDLLAVPVPATDGVSLTRLMNGEAQPELVAYAESLYPRRFGWSPVYSLRDGRFKLIAAPRPELYDLADDPGERINLYDARPAIAAALARGLASFDDREPAQAERRADVVPRGVRERLAALGYTSPVTQQPSPPPR